MKKVNLGPIHRVHIFDDGSFGETQTWPGFEMGFTISGQGQPVLVLDATPEIKKMLKSKDRELYKYDHKAGKFVKGKKAT